MAQFIPAEDPWGEAFRNFGGGIAQGYMQRSDENAVKKAITDLGPNPSARQILDAITNTSTYSPAAKQQALSNYLGVEKFEELKRHAKEQEAIGRARNDIASAKEAKALAKETEEREKTKALVNQLELPEERKAELGETISQRAAEDLLKQQMKTQGTKLTPFEKKVQEKNAEDYINLNKEIPKIESTLGDIAYARQLSNELGIQGTVKGALGLSKKAKELEAISFTLMEPIVKIFNPTGPIAQQKLKMIQDKYVIGPTNPPWIRKAKLDALERFAKQALNRANERMALIKKYDGLPPQGELERFDKESDTLSDAMADYDLLGEEAKEPGLPNPADFKGKTITSPQGQKYHSDGTKWIKR